MKIPTSSIKVEKTDESTKRFRADFGDVQKLKASLLEHGLIHPIVVAKLDPPEPPYEWLLVAGGRRLTAALLLSIEHPEWRFIEATNRDDLDAYQRKALELEENIARKDISWPEQCLATKQLDQLKREQHGSKEKGSLSDEGWTQKDTAKAIGASVGTVCQDIQLANDIIEMPDIMSKVRKMPKAVARKIIEREKKTRKMKDQLERKEIVLTCDFVHGKAEEEIKNLADNSVDCLITDPPWGVDAINDVQRGALTKGADISEGDTGNELEMQKVYDILIPELYRVMAPGAHFYIFFAIDWYHRIREKLEDNNFSVDAVPLIWPKGRGSMVANPYHYIPSYEFVMYGCKNPKQRTLVKPEFNCLAGYPPDAPTKRIHPLQKPLSLIKMFIANSTIIGETVLDPFAGSAVVLKAAESLGRKAVGFEADETHFLMAQEWLMEKEDV
jgi:site-specific DNA-methyltransferase (adenine-specific)